MTARQKRITLVASILGTAIVFIDQTVVNVALPAIRRDLHAGLATQQWVVDAYLLTLGSLLLVGGSLSDLLGRRRVFAAGVAGFGATSILCAAAPDPVLLVVARGVQGVAGALLVPSALAIIVAAFDDDERGAAIGSWTAWGGIAGIAGPLLGGLLVQVSTWRLVFAVNLVPVALAMYLIVRHVPTALDEREHRHVDIPGALLCALGLGGVVTGLIEQPTRSFGDVLVGPAIAAGAACLIAFVLYERRSPAPMLPLGLFRRRNFAVGNVATLLVYAALGAASFFISVYLQQVAGYRPIGAGLALIPSTLIMFAFARRVGGLADRLGPRFFMGSGPIVAGLGLLWFARLGSHASYAADVLPGAVLFGLGLTITVAPLTAAVLAGVDEHQAGIASGVNNAVARVASLIAIAGVGAVVAAQFGSTLDNRVRGVPLNARDQAAVASAQSRPLASPHPGLAPRIDAAVRDASVDGFRAGMLAAALLSIAGGAISAVGIQNPRRRVAARECPGGALVGASRRVGETLAEPTRS